MLGSQTTLTGAGSTFDGGAGTDVLSVGGFVDFQGTLAGIEGIDLLPAFMPTDPSQRGQFVATLDLDTVQYSALPGNAFFRGTGAVIFNITSGSIFSGSTYTFEVGSAVEVAVIGTANADTITGTSANDTLDGKGGNDQLFGLLGDDQYQVDSQADLTFEAIGAGIDTVVASSNYYLFANVENLILHGSAGNIFGVGNELANVLTGNEGENLLIAGASDDTVFGGDSRDAIFGEGGADVLKGEGGIDYIVAGAGNDAVDGGLQADEIYGEDGDDTLYGGSGLFTDIIVGGAGNDTISGSDSFGGNDGDFDFLYGNLGNDTFFVNTPADLVFENPGEGTDTVVANIIGAGFYMYENLENLILDGQTPFGVGNGLANELTGNAIGNFLLGGADNDTLNGKGGGDVLFGEAGADTFVFETGTGGDVIGDFAGGSDKIQINGIFADFAAAQANFIQNGNVGAINLGNGDFIVLHNVTMSQLTAPDFIFG